MWKARVFSGGATRDREQRCRSRVETPPKPTARVMNGTEVFREDRGGSVAYPAGHEVPGELRLLDFRGKGSGRSRREAFLESPLFRAKQATHATHRRRAALLGQAPCRGTDACMLREGGRTRPPPLPYSLRVFHKLRPFSPPPRMTRTTVGGPTEILWGSITRAWRAGGRS